MKSIKVPSLDPTIFGMLKMGCGICVFIHCRSPDQSLSFCMLDLYLKTNHISARALSISLKELTLRPQPFTRTWLTHPDKGGSPEAFHIIQVEYQRLTACTNFRCQLSHALCVERWICTSLFEVLGFFQKKRPVRSLYGHGQKGARSPMFFGSWFLPGAEGIPRWLQSQQDRRTGAPCQFICNRYISLSPYICTSPPPPPKKVWSFKP